MPQILGNSGTMGRTFNSIFYRCAENISIEFNATFNGQWANDIHLRNLFGPTIGTWQITDWTKADNRHNDTLRSMTIAFKQFCECDGLSTILTKVVETHGTIKPQYGTVDNGLGTDHKVAMGLHTWYSGHNDILANNRLILRLGTGQDMRVNSRVTILNNQITMRVAQDNDD
eukprot:1416634-Amphidinium_carterae.1